MDKKIKRILKELGIYSCFIEERKEFIKRHSIKQVSLNLSDFHDLINMAFSWVETKNCKMWKLIHFNTLGMTTDYILKNHKVIESLREVVKNNVIIT